MSKKKTILLISIAAYFLFMETWLFAALNKWSIPDFWVINFCVIAVAGFMAVATAVIFWEDL